MNYNMLPNAEIRLEAFFEHANQYATLKVLRGLVEDYCPTVLEVKVGSIIL